MLRPTIAPLLVVALSAAPAAAATRDWPLTGFERVQLGATADMTIRAGPAFSIRADGDAELVDRLGATVRGGTLYVAWARKPPLLHGRHLHIAVTMPRIAGAGVKGVGHLSVDRAEAPLTVFAVDGTGSLEVAAIRSEKTVLSLSGTGSIEVAGETGRLDATRTGVGSLDAGKLRARSAALRSSGIGSLEARVDGPVAVDHSGIGSVTVGGHPVCTVRHSGIGSVDCG
jgi:hypothetical protein